MKRSNLMSTECSHDCGSCGTECGVRKETKEDFRAALGDMSSIKKVIGVISGKGGVGKSLITSLLAVAMNRRGYHTAIMDADVTGPSIPRVFGLKEKATACEEGIYPVRSATGIDIMSVNLLLENDTDPVIWRGPIVGGMVKQFWTDVIWDRVDYLFIDMPPGTGDVPLTVFQSIAVDGIIVVTSPQEMVGMIVAKAVRMARMMDIPLLGLVENFSFFKCPDNGRDYAIFGESRIEAAAAEYGIPALAKLPVDPRFAAACDKGMIEMADTAPLDSLADMLEKIGKDNDDEQP
jgi:Mrp family chromosome partitioning ATPase